MKRRAGLGVTMIVCAAAEAAEPAVPTAPLAATPTAKPAPTKPLDLRIGDVRRYMLPDEYQTVVSAPDAEKTTVVVEGRRELLPVKYEKPIPVGPLMPVFWALMNPANSWRILLPDINRPPDGPPDVVPAPVFRWGP